MPTLANSPGSGTGNTKEENGTQSSVKASGGGAYYKSYPPALSDRSYLLVPTKQVCEDTAEGIHGQHSWKWKVLKTLHSPKAEWFFMSLLVLDVFVLFTEIFLLAEFPLCHIIERDAISCCPADAGYATNTSSHDRSFMKRVLAASGDDYGVHHHYCDAGVENLEYSAGCDGHKWHRVHTAEEYLFFITITILSTFFLELNFSMIALTPRIFFGHAFFLADYVIITISLALELTLHYLDEDAIQSFVGMLVIVRIWRFVRIGHGIVEVAHELSSEKYHKLLAYTEEVERLLKANNIALPEGAPSIHHETEEGNLWEKLERKRLERIKSTSK